MLLSAGPFQESSSNESRKEIFQIISSVRAPYFFWIVSSAAVFLLALGCRHFCASRIIIPRALAWASSLVFSRLSLSEGKLEGVVTQLHCRGDVGLRGLLVLLLRLRISRGGL